MGWSEDLLFAGLITEDEREELKELGKSIKHYGNVEDLEDLWEIAYQFGLEELGDRLVKDYLKAIDHYEALYDYQIYYDHEVERWRANITGRIYFRKTGEWINVSKGQFFPDPYEWIRD